MSPGKVALYIVLGLVGLVVMSAIITAVFAAIAIVWLLLRLLVVLLVLGGTAYVGYHIYRLLSGAVPLVGRSNSTASPGPAESASDGGIDRVEQLKQQYTDGKITEREFERKLERELDDRQYDSIDRELQRERL